MGEPAPLAEQLELARQYCPDLLEKLRKSEANLATMKYRRRKQFAGIGLHETIGVWVERMRKEIAAELQAEADGKIELLTGDE